MALERQLKRWTLAGLIDAGQAERIRAFEKEGTRPALLYAITGLGGLAMAIGLVSIVAANWDIIPGRLKLALDLACVAAVGYGVLHGMRRGRPWLRETSILVMYGLVLASVALIGQVYQLGGNAAAALGAWSVMTFLLMAQGRSISLGFAWLAGLEATYIAGLFELVDFYPEAGQLALLASYWVPLACLAIGRSAWVQRVRPHYASVFSAAGWAQLLLSSSAATLGFYEGRAVEPDWSWLAVVMSLAGTAWLWATSEKTPAGRASRWLLVVAFVVAHVPLTVPHGEWPVAAAVAFIGLWWVVAIAAYRAGRGAVLHVATAIIGVRLLITYFEVFGSLLDTGVGLVTGGLLTLLMTWFWARKRRELESELPRRPRSAEEASP
jgi:uncharacterized membrane protein